jgi:cytochrome c biogenesis protein CcdA/glutaredoxin
MSGRWSFLWAVVFAAAAVLAAPAARADDQIGPMPPTTVPAPSTATTASEGVEIVLFYGDGCPHCAAEKKFLASLEERYEGVQVSEYEVWYDAQNRSLLMQVASERGFDASGVPITLLGDQVWIGWSDSLGQQIEGIVAAALAGVAPPVVDDDPVVDVPLVGAVDLGGSSLLVSTIVIGFVDGVNPCSLWVLSMLLALVLHSGSRSRVAVVGVVFLVVTAGLYGLYMVGLFSALDYIGMRTWVRVGLAVLAGGLGLLHLKEYFWFKQGLSLTIPDEKKPGLYKKMRALAAPDRSLPAALGATAVLAVGVSLLETPCTAGLPVLWTGMLADQDVAWTEAALLFAVYMAVFLLDELIVFGAAVVTMRAAKLQERHGRLLELISGTVMVALALVLLFAPALMESPAGALAVFGAAAAVVAAVVLVARYVTPRHRPAVR